MKKNGHKSWGLNIQSLKLTQLTTPWLLSPVFNKHLARKLPRLKKRLWFEAGTTNKTNLKNTLCSEICLDVWRCSCHFKR